MLLCMFGPTQKYLHVATPSPNSFCRPSPQYDVLAWIGTSDRNCRRMPRGTASRAAVDVACAGSVSKLVSKLVSAGYHLAGRETTSSSFYSDNKAGFEVDTGTTATALPSRTAFGRLETIAAAASRRYRFATTPARLTSGPTGPSVIALP